MSQVDLPEKKVWEKMTGMAKRRVPLSPHNAYMCTMSDDFGVNWQAIANLRGATDQQDD